MVWSPIGYHLEIIDYDPVFWEGVEQILENFYMNCLLPEIIDPRAPRGLPIREPDYIVEVCIERKIRLLFLFPFAGTKPEKSTNMTIGLFEHRKDAR